MPRCRDVVRPRLLWRGQNYPLPPPIRSASRLWSSSACRAQAPSVSARLRVLVKLVIHEGAGPVKAVCAPRLWSVFAVSGWVWECAVEVSVSGLAVGPPRQGLGLDADTLRAIVVHVGNPRSGGGCLCSWWGRVHQGSGAGAGRVAGEWGQSGRAATPSRGVGPDQRRLRTRSRPACSRRLGCRAGQGTDVPVAQPVVDEREHSGRLAGTVVAQRGKYAECSGATTATRVGKSWWRRYRPASSRPCLYQGRSTPAVARHVPEDFGGKAVGAVTDS